MNSTHKVEVVRLGKIGRHPNADTLEISTIFGYPVCFKEQQYKEGDLVAFVPPDNVLPNLPEYDFLGSNRRITAKKLRGVPSFGLLLKAPEGSVEGDDVAQLLGITHYEPPVQNDFKQGEAGPGPKCYAPVYDVETSRKYAHIFEENEPVICLEKIHGQNIRVKYNADEDKMYVGSKEEWKRYTKDNCFWKSLEFSPGVEDFCRENPQCVLYGESAGNVQKGFSYGVEKGRARIFVFDIMKDGVWMDYKNAREITQPYGVEWCPEIAVNILYKFDTLCQLAEGPSLVPGATNIREGLVAFPAKDRSHIEVGRVKLKFVSLAYLEGKKK